MEQFQFTWNFMKNLEAANFARWVSWITVGVAMGWNQLCRWGRLEVCASLIHGTSIHHSFQKWFIRKIQMNVQLSVAEKW